MQRVTLVRYAAKPGRADENEVLSRAVFNEIRANAPKDIAYAVFRDGDDFLHLFVNLKTEDSSQVTELPSFKAYTADILARSIAAPEQTRFSAELREAYGFG